ncbi:MAG: hypothetical protein RL380_713 [Verrucomicrobiota bacterium]|jgi:hypothetical protein
MKTKNFLGEISHVALLLVFFLAGWSDTAGALPFQWLNPPISSHSFNLQSVDSANGIFVMVGRKAVKTPFSTFTNYFSMALVSADGTNWTECPVGNATNLLTKVVFLNGKFVTVGSQGMVAYSTNGTNWTVTSTGITNDLSGITYGAGLYACVGTSGKIITSPDLTNWTPRASPTASSFNCIAYGNSTFLASGTTSVRSSDGVTWTLANTNLDYLTFGNGVFVGFNHYYLAPYYTAQVGISTNGSNWNWGITISLTGSGGSYIPRYARYMNGRFTVYGTIGGGFSGLFTQNNYSTDGTNWVVAPSTYASPSSDVSTHANDMAYNNGVYVIVTTLAGYEIGSYYTSPGNDGLTNYFQQNMGYQTANFTNTPLGSFRSTATGNGVTVGMTSFGQPVLITTDGTNFSSVNATNPTSRPVVKFGGGQFMAAGDNSTTVLQSTNGLQWFARTAGGAVMNAICYGSNLLVAVGVSGAISTSPTGLIWTTRTSGTLATLNGVDYHNGQYVAVGASGTVVTSPDGLNWTVQYSGTLNSLNDVSFGNGLFVADGNAGTIITSTDGVNWTTRFSGTTNNLGRLTFASGRFITATGFLLSSLDGVNWQKETMSYNVSFNYVYALNGRIWASGTLGEVYQSDLLGQGLLARMLPANGGYQITLSGLPGNTCRVQSCTNLGGTWQDVITLTNVSGQVIWTDTNSPSGQRYYRTISP